MVVDRDVGKPILARLLKADALPSRCRRDQYGLVGIERLGVMMSVYRVIDVIGTSASSWEEAAREAITTAAGSLHDLRVAEVTKQDVVVGEDGTLLFRARIQLSFKYAPE
ncbi:dodecin family protein [Microbacterium sp. B2969]|uniref:Dodecin family protein n=1 Tax=Microbacterium alkaliflavum TaxID=3248839 RepID=A0ABW7Q1R7_9MICO